MNKYILIFIIIIILLLNYKTHYQGKTFYEKRLLDNKKNVKVFDISRRILPDLRESFMARFLVDFILILLAVLLVQSNGFIEFLQYLPIIFLIRGITTYVTILPKDSKCDDSSYSIVEMIKGHCYDKIFSGHLAFTFLALLILYNKGFITNQLIFLSILLLHSFLILAIRSHYTIDLIVTLFVVITVYKLEIKIPLTKK
jgi:hypothetical protein